MIHAKRETTRLQNNLLIMILNALMIFNLFLNGVKAPGTCDGFPCCNNPVNNPVYDTKGKAYGYENEQSCVILN